MENQQHNNTQSSSSDETSSFEEVEQEETQIPPFFKRFDPSAVLGTIKQSYIAKVLLVLFAVWLGIKLLGKLIFPRSRTDRVTAPVTTLENRTEVDTERESLSSLGVGQSHATRTSLLEHGASKDLEARLTKMQVSLDQLNFQLSALQSKWINLEGRIKQIREGMQPVHQWVQNQLKSVNKAVKREAGSKEKSRQALYNLRAIQKGRAWLSTENGEELTVQEGDLIPGYGVVLIIDFINKLVKLSNGAVFGFSSNPALDSVSPIT